jgi:hypothetical protein
MVARTAQEEIRDSETFELIEAKIIECECKAHVQLMGQLGEWLRDLRP